MSRRIIKWIVLAFAASLLMGCAAINKGDTNSNIPNPVQPPSDTTPIKKDPIKVQLEAMSLDEKMGQMMIAGLDGYEINDHAKALIENYDIGGFILFGRNIRDPEQLVKLTNSLREANAVNSVPLFISVDEEGGRISRIPKVIRNFPANRAIGSINNKEFSYEVGRLLGEKVKAFGFNMDYAPVLDINSNPNNPVIGDRAFGSEAAAVSELGVQTMKGISSRGVIPVVKHFPGHGDTSVDSHVGLPSVNNDLNRLKSFELVPFEKAIDNGADSIMVAHILLTKIDSQNPATLSKAVVTDLLRQQLGFKGVVITDDMTMGAITENYEIGDAAVRAIQAGCDIVLVAHEYENALTVMEELKSAVQEGTVSEEQIDQSVYRILSMKQKYNLQDIRIENPDIDEINNNIDNLIKTYMK